MALAQQLQTAFRNLRPAPGISPATPASEDPYIAQVQRNLGAGAGSPPYDYGSPYDIGMGGAAGLRQINRYQFFPELERARRLRSPIESAFFSQALQPGALYGAASEAAAGTARQLFAPGGEVSQLIRGARGQSIQRGFDPSSAEGGERGIINAANQRVADTFATTAAQLEGQRFNALTGAYGEAGATVRDLLESLYAGTAGAEQLHLSSQAFKESKKRGLLGLGLGPL